MSKEKRNIIITGSGRSGTSLVAGLFASGGYFMGENLYEAREANPKGFFEDPEINGINEELIGLIQEDDFVGQKAAQDQRWLAAVMPGARLSSTPELIERIKALVAREPYCFKDPRFSYTLPIWRPFLNNPLYLCVFREPAITANSIVKEHRLLPYMKDLRMNRERAIRIWTMQYSWIYETLRKEGDWMFIHYDQVFQPKTLDEIEKRSGCTIDRSFPAKDLKRSKPTFLVPENTQRLYRELCGLAGYGSAEPDLERIIHAQTELVEDLEARLEAQIQSKKEAVARLEGEIEARQQDLDLLKQQVEQLAREVGDRAERLAERAMTGTTLWREFDELRGILRDREAVITQATRKVEELQNEVDSIRNSTSWRLSAPIRLIGKIGKKG